MTEQPAIVPRQPYTPPEVTCVTFRLEKGYTVSSAPPMEQFNQFQLFIYDEAPQGQHGIEQMSPHLGWGENDNHFFN